MFTSDEQSDGVHSGQFGQLVVGEHPAEVLLALQRDPHDLAGVHAMRDEVVGVADPIEQLRQVKACPDDGARIHERRQGFALIPTMLQ
nr:hypothetical protein [Amycolatopsis xylanica]